MIVLVLFFGVEFGKNTIDSGVVVTIDPPNVTRFAHVSIVMMVI